MPDQVLAEDVGYVVPNDSSTWITVGNYSLRIAVTKNGEASVQAFFRGQELEARPFTELRLVGPRED